ncbi:MAG: hypothetical protein RIC89_04565, partial [Pseudomonadales bacterium]
MRSAVLILVLTLGFSAAATADSTDQAKRIHDRIAGVPPDSATLASMRDDIDSGNALDAALEATN